MHKASSQAIIGAHPISLSSETQQFRTYRLKEFCKESEKIGKGEELKVIF